jgi:hypothetical protein
MFDDRVQWNPVIVGGQTDTGDPAVVLVDLGEGICTGTVIATKVVLTAAHCLQPTPAVLQARFVNEAGNNGPSIEGVAPTVAPEADIAVFALAQAAPVPPIAFNTQSLETMIGQPVRVVGFGVTAEGGRGAGIKRQGVSNLLSVTPGGVKGLKAGEMAASNNPVGTCYGDSGGPNFMTIGGKEYVVGTTSRGNDECGAGQDLAVRTDSNAAFISGFIQAHP